MYSSRRSSAWTLLILMSVHRPLLLLLRQLLQLTSFHPSSSESLIMLKVDDSATSPYLQQPPTYDANTNFALFPSRHLANSNGDSLTQACPAEDDAWPAGEAAVPDESSDRQAPGKDVAESSCYNRLRQPSKSRPHGQHPQQQDPQSRFFLPLGSIVSTPMTPEDDLLGTRPTDINLNALGHVDKSPLVASVETSFNNNISSCRTGSGRCDGNAIGGGQQQQLTNVDDANPTSGDRSDMDEMGNHVGRTTKMANSTDTSLFHGPTSIISGLNPSIAYIDD